MCTQPVQSGCTVGLNSAGQQSVLKPNLVCKNSCIADCNHNCGHTHCKCDHSGVAMLLGLIDMILMMCSRASHTVWQGRQIQPTCMCPSHLLLTSTHQCTATMACAAKTLCNLTSPGIINASACVSCTILAVELVDHMSRQPLDLLWSGQYVCHKPRQSLAFCHRQLKDFQLASHCDDHVHMTHCHSLILTCQSWTILMHKLSWSCQSLLSCIS